MKETDTCKKKTFSLVRACDSDSCDSDNSSEDSDSCARDNYSEDSDSCASDNSDSCSEE